MRLIDAEAWKLDLLLLHGTNERTAWIINRINHAPTIDAVPVIRCKDCKKFVTEEDQAYCLDMYGQCDENGFCAWAERKGE